MENTKDIQEFSPSALHFVMHYYNIPKEDALLYYKDEIQSYENLRSRFEGKDNFELVKMEHELGNNLYLNSE